MLFPDLRGSCSEAFEEFRRWTGGYQSTLGCWVRCCRWVWVVVQVSSRSRPSGRTTRHSWLLALRSCESGAEGLNSRRCGNERLIYSIYPVDVIKSKIQTDALDPTKRQYKGMMDCIRKTWSKEGWRGFMGGLGPTLIR